MFKIKRKEVKAEVGRYFIYGNTVYKIVKIAESGTIRVAYKNNEGELRCFPSTITASIWEESIKSGKSFKPLYEDEVLDPDLKAFKYPDDV